VHGGERSSENLEAEYLEGGAFTVQMGLSDVGWESRGPTNMEMICKQQKTSRSQGGGGNKKVSRTLRKLTRIYKSWGEPTVKSRINGIFEAHRE